MLDNLSNEYFTGISYHFIGADPYLFIPDTHRGFEILHVVNGSGHILIGNRIFDMLPKSIFFINGATFHYTNPDDPDKYVRNKVHFSQTEFIDVLRAFEQTLLLEPFFKSDSFYTCIRLSDKTNAIVDQLFHEMAEESRSHGVGHRLVIFSLLLKALSMAFRDAPAKSNNPIHDLDKVSTNAMNVVKYIDNHLATFDIDSMADYLFLNKYYLYHMFKKVTGLTINEYLLQKRIESAKFLLSSSDSPVSQIAMELGFGSFSLFSSNFRKVCGLTPREYRKKCQSNNTQ